MRFAAVLIVPAIAAAQLGPMPSSRLVELTGAVLLEHGGRPSEPMRIMLRCMGRLEMAAVTDNSGRFRFRFDPSQNRDGICQVFAEKPGVESSKVTVPTIYPSDASVHLGTIRISDGTAGVVSVTSADAPKTARKKLERARKLIERRKPDPAAAAAELEEAVVEYELYTEAWLELAGVLVKLDQPEAALEAYGKAIDADPAFPLSYRPAIKLARRQENVVLVGLWCADAVRVDPTLRDACSAQADLR